ncbi:hypothetical protein TSO221_03485 [Azospirillum sp. TSO22-1]|nr:hypothetical protein TSO221_03485 [Azospirillum sp. TSO22-1]
MRDGGDLFVPLGRLSKWFEMGFAIDMRELALRLSPKSPLPIQERLARQQGLVRPVLGRANELARLPRLEAQYEPLTWPTIDATGGPRWLRGNNGTSSAGVRYSAVGTGDLAYANAAFFVSGDTSTANGALVDQARVTLRRFDPDGGMLGPMGATALEAGEVRTAMLPVIGGAQFERGVRVTNQPLGYSTVFDSTDIVGDAPIDWDVELYRNDSLIATQRVGVNGRYSFTNIDLFLGRNDFKLVFLGPQGQRREEARSIPVGLGLATPGKLFYEMSLSQKDTPFYRRGFLREPTMGSGRINAYFNYGLNENLSVGGGVSSVELVDGRVSYALAGVTAQALGVLGQVNAIVDSRGGRGIDAVVQTDVLGHSVRLSQRYLDDLTEPGVQRGRRMRTGLSIYNTISDPAGLRFGYGVSGNQSWGPDSQSTTSLSGRLSVGYRATNLAVSAGADRLRASDGTVDTRGTGSVTAYTVIEGIRIAGSAQMQGRPRPEVSTYFANIGTSLGRGVWGEVEAGRSLHDGVSTGTARMAWDLGRATIGPRFSVSSNGHAEAMLELTTSILREPRGGGFMLAGTPQNDLGGVSVRVFQDDPLAGSAGRPVKGATVVARQASMQAVTDENGVAVITGLPVHKATDVAVEPGSLPDPYLMPVVEGHSVVPRPGVIQRMDVAVTQVGSLEGRIVAPDEAGALMPQRGLPVRLLKPDGSVLATSRTAYDGLYTFDNVPPGTYTVDIDPQVAERRGLPGGFRRTVAVAPEGGPVDLGEVALGRGAAPAMLAAQPAAPSAAALPAASPAAPQIAAAPAKRVRSIVVGSYGSQLGAVADVVVLRRKFPALLAGAAGKPQVAPDPASGRFALVIELGPDPEAAVDACRQIMQGDRPCRIQENAV